LRFAICNLRLLVPFTALVLSAWLISGCASKIDQRGQTPAKSSTAAAMNHGCVRQLFQHAHRHPLTIAAG